MAKLLRGAIRQYVPLLNDMDIPVGTFVIEFGATVVHWDEKTSYPIDPGVDRLGILASRWLSLQYTFSWNSARLALGMYCLMEVDINVVVCDLGCYSKRDFVSL